MPRHRYSLVLILLLILRPNSRADSAAQPTTEPNGDIWKLLIVHPSLDKDQLYRCVITIPASRPVNENMGFTLVLINRAKQMVGIVPLYMGKLIEGERSVECRIDADLVKNSYLMFQLDPNADTLSLVKIVLGEHETFRRVGQEMVHEPIE